MAKIISVQVRTVRIPLKNPTAFAQHQVTSRDYSLVKVQTDDGLEGIGHCYAGGSGGNVVTIAVREMLAPLLIGAGKAPSLLRVPPPSHSFRDVELGRRRNEAS
jgi:L-alanine-DL-glutamate epimerase-like enolase superfamily enzyme